MTYCTDEDFALWAFGDKWKHYMMSDCDPIVCMNAWNELHGDLLMLNRERIIRDDLKVMKKLWEKHKE